jgi:ABC-type transporter Mla subunit MlaD
LNQSLQALLLAAEQGDWNKISTRSDHLLPELEAVRAPNPSAQKVSQHAEQIRQTLTLLNTAIEQCSERKAQIEPLVKALIPTKASSNIP